MRGSAELERPLVGRQDVCIDGHQVARQSYLGQLYVAVGGIEFPRSISAQVRTFYFLGIPADSAYLGFFVGKLYWLVVLKAQKQSYYSWEYLTKMRLWTRIYG